MATDPSTNPNKVPSLDSQLMLNRLKEDSFPNMDNQVFLDDGIRAFFDELFQTTGLKKSDVIRKANISRTYGYQILDGTRLGKRDYYLNIALAMQLDLRTTQRMLAVTSSGSLHPLLKRDAAVIFALNHGYDNIKTYEFMCQLDLPPLETGFE
jgi:hypothetical protein